MVNAEPCVGCGLRNGCWVADGAIGNTAIASEGRDGGRVEMNATPAVEPAWDFRDDRTRGRCFYKRDFAGINLRYARLQDTCLRHADLSEAENLSAESLGGADLTGATLPAPVEGFTALKGIEEASKYLQTIFRITLLLCGFSALTVLSSRDENLILHHVQQLTLLPFIQAAISPIQFAWIMPGIVLILLVYELTYLGETWLQLSFLPAIFPDGMPLDRRAYPLTLNALIRRHSRRLEDSPPAFFQIVTSYFMIFGIALMTLLVFWLGYLRARNAWIIGFQIFTLGVAANLTVFHVRLSRVLLGGTFKRGEVIEVDRCSPATTTPPPDLLDKWFRSIMKYQDEMAIAILREGQIYHDAVEVAIAAPTRTPTSVFLLGALKSLPGFLGFCIPFFVTVALFLITTAILLYGFPKSSHLFHLDLDHRVLSQRPDNWDGSKDLHLEQVNVVDLEGVNLTHANARGVFLAKVDLKNARLRYADLRQADLRQADLSGADLTGANLAGADLAGADLSEANLEDVIGLTQAQIDQVKAARFAKLPHGIAPPKQP